MQNLHRELNPHELGKRMFEQHQMLNSREDDKELQKIIDILATSGVDVILQDKLKPSTKDDQLNDLLCVLENSFYDVIRYLEKQGLITISGIKIQKVRNK